MPRPGAFDPEETLAVQCPNCLSPYQSPCFSGCNAVVRARERGEFIALVGSATYHRSGNIARGATPPRSASPPDNKASIARIIGNPLSQHSQIPAVRPIDIGL